MSWCFNASNPREKIFALLALASQSTTTKPIMPDYTTPTATLFMQGAQGEPCAWDEVIAVYIDGAGGDNGEYAGFGHNIPQGWLGLLLQMKSTYISGCSRLEALWRTLQVNHTIQPK